MNISDLGEFALIDLIRKQLPTNTKIIRGIGDDTAVLPYSKDKYLLFTTDMLAEGVHFTTKMSAQAIGHKALACNISDIAAMGGLPTSAVVSIALPKTTPVAWVQHMYKGMGALAKQFKVNIVGGDTIKSHKIVINVALLGEVEKKYLITRDGAKSGDWIFVTGPLAGSLKSGRHLNFTPRIEQARFLVQNFKPSAMMDISDGLSGDLNHILNASNVGAEMFKESIPLNKGSTLTQAMSDGEDFELLFTLNKAKSKMLMKWQQTCKVAYFYTIGQINADIKKKVYAKSFTHF